MPYCLYLRKSRADLDLEAKGELETLSRHRKALLDLAKQRKLSITQIYEEIVSGETIESRPVVRRLLDEVEQGKWQGVLVMEIERLARGDTIDQGVVARAFKLGHTKIITPIKEYDPDNEFDEEFFEFGLFMSRREYKTINRRIQRGRIASAKEGKFIGSTPPYGYEKMRIHNDKGYTLEPDEKEAPVVQLIFELYIKGSGMNLIARHLDSIGITPRHRDTWSKSTINDILANPVYTGRIRWSFRKEEKYIDNGKTRKRRSINSEPILVQGLHAPIITLEQYETAQNIRQQNIIKKTRENYSLQNPLSGIVYCKLCGHLMTRLGKNERSQYDTLRCPGLYCTNISAPVFLIEEKLIRELQHWTDTYRTNINVLSNASENNSLTANKKALVNLEHELQKISEQISSTYDLLEQGVYTVEVFTSRNASLSERRNQTQEKLSHIKEQIEQINQSRNKKVNISRMIRLLDEYRIVQSVKRKNNILHRILEKVEYIKTSPNKKGAVLNDNFELSIFPKLTNL